jgi:predicted porin
MRRTLLALALGITTLLMLTGNACAQEVGPQPPSSEPLLEKLLKGFYGTLDVSFEGATKGISGLTAFPYALNDPANPDSGFTISGPAKAGPVGRVGWMPEISTNKSGAGYRSVHAIGKSGIDFAYQIEAALSLTSSPGLATSWTQQSNVVRAALGFGDSFVGFRNENLGAIKLGVTYAPYKKSTDRLNPFSGMLGDYAVVMGNSGGDNRVEYGTRLDHSIWYESPKIANLVSFDFLWSPGQNRTYDNVIQSAGSPDCNGGNMPGSGNLPLNCDDGGFADAISADVRFELGGLYVTGAVEWHNNVNRNSDGIGSNNPLYPFFVTTYPGQVISATNNPQGLPASALGAYVNDIGNEYAAKVGAQYVFDFGLSVGGIFEILRRNIPAILGFQNERTRNGTWLTASQKIFGNGTLSVGWAHATRTPGDPGGQHNYNPLAGDNTANMITAAYKHQLDKQLSVYIDFADTINNGNAHYDLGAGGRGLTTDCHDGTNTVFIDYSSTGPTTWSGCNIVGISSGVHYTF